MIKNYLLITLRSMMKNKLFIFINVFGMGIAIATCIVAYLNWDFSASWDSSQVNASKIYRIQLWREFQEKRERYGSVPMPLGNHIRHNSKDVSKVVRYVRNYNDVRIGEELFGTQFAYTDSAFFELFTYKLKYGSFTDFYDKSKVFISDIQAKKYFNQEDVVGRTITQIVIRQNGERVLKEFTVGGVYQQLPFNSSFQFDAITLF